MARAASAQANVEPSTSVSPRTYRSPLRMRRAEETRRALLKAAQEIFTMAGWAGTGMREVAAAAGVATETLYSHFPSKRALFQAVVDIAVVGDEEPVPLAERAEFATLGRGTRADRIANAARILAGVHARTAPFAKVLREAAHVEAEIADVLAATRERQRQDVSAAANLIVGHPVDADERDGLWALTSPEVYLLLVDASGWTVDQYQSWIVEMLDRTLPRTSRTRCTAR